MTNKPLSRQTKKYLKQEIPEFLDQALLKNKGLPLSNYLGYVLAGFYLLPLDIKIKTPFIRFQDDYLIFFKNKNDIENCLNKIIIPTLNSLDLQINIKKLQSGQAHKDRLTFLGYDYFGGYFLINKEKIALLKTRIIKITHLTSKKPTKAVVKKLNYKTKGFGHYYKFCSANNIFQELDSFIRMRLRRYITRNKNSLEKLPNLLLTNKELVELGLLSLNSIYTKYDPKFKYKNQKNKKKSEKTSPKSKFKSTIKYQEKRK